MPDPSNDAPGLTVVLSCHGPGSDASTFRPRRDESQWWQRRYALVRCVAAFLGGPSLEVAGGGQATYHSSSRRRLVLLFDEDWARMELEYDDNTSSEENNEDDSRMTVGPSPKLCADGTKRHYPLSKDGRLLTGDDRHGRETARHPAIGSTHHDGSLLV